jgi:hypothetical protein
VTDAEREDAVSGVGARWRLGDLAGDHARQQPERLRRGAARLAVVDDERLAVCAVDDEGLVAHVDLADDRAVDAFGAVGAHTDVVARP